MFWNEFQADQMKILKSTTLIKTKSVRSILIINRW